MISLASLLLMAHFIGLALAVGAATVKLVLLLKCRADPSFIPAYAKVSKPVTRHIMVGMLLLTASGVAWLVFEDSSISTLFIVKLALVAGVWILGPVIDTKVEPRFHELAPKPGESPSAIFLQAQRRFVGIELLATGIFYLIIVIWVRE